MLALLRYLSRALAWHVFGDFMDDSFRDAVAERAWATSGADSLLSEKKDLFMAGFIVGWGAHDEAMAVEMRLRDSILMGRLESIFTASLEAGKARPQSGAEDQHWASSREMPAGLAFEQSVAGRHPQPSSVQDEQHEVREQQPEVRPPEGRQIPSGLVWVDRVLYSLKRAFRKRETETPNV